MKIKVSTLLDRKAAAKKLNDSLALKSCPADRMGDIYHITEDQLDQVQETICAYVDLVEALLSSAEVEI